MAARTIRPIVCSLITFCWAGRFFLVVGGRILGPRLHPTPQRHGGRQWSDLAGIFSIMLFFIAITFALIYEAVGVRESLTRGIALTQIQELEPITHYVRCAIFYDKQGSIGNIGFWSYGLFALTSFLVGHWLWPLQSSDRAAGSSLAGSPETDKAILPPLPAAILTLVIAAGFIGGGILLLNLAFGANPIVRAAVGGIPPTGDSFRIGIMVVIGFVFLVFLAISVLDMWFASQRWNSIGLRVQHWSRVNPWFAFGLLVVLGALVAHFVGNEIRYPTPGSS